MHEREVASGAVRGCVKDGSRPSMTRCRVGWLRRVSARSMMSSWIRMNPCRNSRLTATASSSASSTASGGTPRSARTAENPVRQQKEQRAQPFARAADELRQIVVERSEASAAGGNRRAGGPDIAQCRVDPLAATAHFLGGVSSGPVATAIDAGWPRGRRTEEQRCQARRSYAKWSFSDAATGISALTWRCCYRRRPSMSFAKTLAGLERGIAAAVRGFRPPDRALLRRGPGINGGPFAGAHASSTSAGRCGCSRRSIFPTSASTTASTAGSRATTPSCASRCRSSRSWPRRGTSRRRVFATSCWSRASIRNSSPAATWKRASGGCAGSRRAGRLAGSRRRWKPPSTCRSSRAGAEGLVVYQETYHRADLRGNAHRRAEARFRLAAGLPRARLRGGFPAARHRGAVRPVRSGRRRRCARRARRLPAAPVLESADHR